MVGMGEISGLFSALKGAKDIAEAMIALRDASALQSKVIEFQSAIMDAQQRVLAVQEERSALIEKISQLEAELARMKAWEAEKERYELKRVGYAGSATVYALKAGMEAGEEPHSVCANCYESGTKSILQGDRAKGDTFLVCPRCRTRLLTGGHGNSRP